MAYLVKEPFGGYRYHFLDKYYIPIDPDDFKTRDDSVDGRGYFHFLTHKARQVEQEAEALYNLLQHCKGQFKGNRVVELFGGIGMFSTILRDQLVVKDHRIFELDQFCLNHLEKLAHTWSSGVVRLYGFDAHENAPGVVEKGDFVVADFNTFTILDILKTSPKAVCLSRILHEKPQFVELTDSAVNKIHINAKTYGRWLGTEVNNFDDYLVQLSRHLFSCWGYRIQYVYYHSGAAYLLLERARKFYEPKTVVKL